MNALFYWPLNAVALISLLALADLGLAGFAVWLVARRSR